jgi:DnaK suppressor protein
MSASPERFTPEQMRSLREAVESELARLERGLKTTRRAARPVKLDQTSVGRLSRMDAIQNQSLTRGLEARQEQRAAVLRVALERIEQGTYGACEGCGGAIAFERLMLFPETPTCAACAR